MTDPTNRTRDLAFADSHLGAILVENVRDYEADGIVVNLTARTIYTGGDVPTPIRPWRSTILRGQTVMQDGKPVGQPTGHHVARAKPEVAA